MTTQPRRFLSMLGAAYLLISQLTCVTNILPVDTTLPSPDPTAHPVAAGPTSIPLGTFDKWALWTNGTQLRGANIYQRRVYPELDGPEFMGSGPVGPPTRACRIFT